MKKRFRKVTEWYDGAVVIFIASIIILFLSVAFIATNWDRLGREEPFYFIITELLCFAFAGISILTLLASLSKLKEDEYYEEIKE